jgi:hypothetical protein
LPITNYRPPTSFFLPITGIYLLFPFLRLPHIPQQIGMVFAIHHPPVEKTQGFHSARAVALCIFSKLRGAYIPRRGMVRQKPLHRSGIGGTIACRCRLRGKTLVEFIQPRCAATHRASRGRNSGMPVVS